MPRAMRIATGLALLGSVAAVTDIEAGQRLNGIVEEHQYTCFKWTVSADQAASYRHQYVRVVHDNLESDPDLYVKKGEQPTKEDHDYEDHSLNPQSVIESPPSEGDWYACVYGYRGLTSFWFELANTKCVTNVYDEPTSPGGGVSAVTTIHECTDHGTCDELTYTCNCDVGHKMPGATDCSAKVEDLSLTNPLQPYVSKQRALAAGEWEYFHINTLSVANELRVTMTRMGDEGDPDIFLRFGNPPTRQEFDVRDTTIEAEHSLVATRNETQFYSTDVWVGIYAVTATSFKLEASVYVCPNNCSNHGDCNPSTAVCQCDDEWNVVGVHNCSMTSHKLEHNGDLELINIERESFAFFEMAIDNDVADNHVELELLARWEGRAPYAWQHDLPLLLVRKGTELPMPTNYDFQLILEGNTTNHFIMPASKLKAGSWKVSLWNPYGWTIVTDVTMKLQSFCPNNCNNNGHCKVSGQCNCDDGFIGADCVPIPKLPKGEKKGSSAASGIFGFLAGAAVAAGGLAYYIRNVNPHLFRRGVGYSGVGGDMSDMYDPPVE